MTRRVFLTFTITYYSLRRSYREVGVPSSGKHTNRISEPDSLSSCTTCTVPLRPQLLHSPSLRSSQERRPLVNASTPQGSILLQTSLTKRAPLPAWQRLSSRDSKTSPCYWRTDCTRCRISHKTTADKFPEIALQFGDINFGSDWLVARS
jgi:hypothetical protein